MNQSFSGISTQTVDGPIGSYNTVTHTEHHVHQMSEVGQDDLVNVLLSQISAVMTRPQSCHLDDSLKRSARRTALAIPDLPVIESIVSQSSLQTFGRNNGPVNDWRATTAEIQKIRSMVQNLLEPNIDEGVLLWQTLARLFGSLGSKFAGIGWFVGALRMSYHEVRIRCALANLQSQTISESADLSTISVNPTCYPHHVEFLSAISNLLHHRSLYSANVFCFNDARKASEQAIRIQRCLCMHDSANTEFNSTFSWMQRHLSSFRRQDAAYSVCASRLIGNMDTPFPPDITNFDKARAGLRAISELSSTQLALVCLISAGPMTAGTVLVTGLGIGQILSFINRRS